VNLKIEDVRIMSMPQFTAEASLYRTNTRYRLATSLASNVQISPAFKGTICAFSGSPKCPGGSPNGSVLMIPVGILEYVVRHRHRRHHHQPALRVKIYAPTVGSRVVARWVLTAAMMTMVAVRMVRFAGVFSVGISVSRFPDRSSGLT